MRICVAARHSASSASVNANYPQGVEDNTHFSPFGAEIMARLVVKEIKELQLGLAKFLKDIVTEK